MRDTNVCDSVGIGQEVYYEAEISLTNCDSPGIRRHSFSIKPHDLSDTVEVEIEAQCECDCQDKVTII